MTDELLFADRGFISDEDDSLDGFALHLSRYRAGGFEADLRLSDGTQCVHFAYYITSPAEAQKAIAELRALKIAVSTLIHKLRENMPELEETTKAEKEA